MFLFLCEYASLRLSLFFNHPITKPITIVIDAGHGGKDSGAIGKLHKEKDLALTLALKLGMLLTNEDPSLNIIYTRTEDVFIPLYKRADIANKHKADLFISIHCNYISNPHIRGTETFVLGTHRADDNFEIAKRENDVILLETNYENHYDGFDPQSPLGHIVLTSVQNAYLHQSLSIAQAIEKEFDELNQVKSRGVKQAGFAVLRRATMPCILVETGFLSNVQEEQYLGSETGQNEICSALKNAIMTKLVQPKELSITTSIVSDTTKSINSEIKLKNNKIELIKSSKSQTKNYKIQIAALKNPPNSLEKQRMEKLGILHEKFVNGIYKYQIGDFTDYTSALLKKEDLKEAGYFASFIIEETIEE
jgi:N-acetylmuramoyl-L-alanine amidase